MTILCSPLRWPSTRAAEHIYLGMNWCYDLRGRDTKCDHSLIVLSVMPSGYHDTLTGSTPRRHRGRVD